MLGLAKRVGARFLLTSTSEVYGDPLQHPQKETYWGNVNPIGQHSFSYYVLRSPPAFLGHVQNQNCQRHALHLLQHTPCETYFSKLNKKRGTEVEDHVVGIPGSGQRGTRDMLVHKMKGRDIFLLLRIHSHILFHCNKAALVKVLGQKL